MSRFIYLLRDADSAIVYIGQSRDVARRLQSHYDVATRNHYAAHRTEIKRRTLEWLPAVRSVEVLGPFRYREALDRERSLIEQHQPRGNRMFTIAHGWAS
jgi:excinuclease UvrABC nuclease subunit